jgi:diguanylate cyclase (GGDEF)-like protein
MGNQEPFPAERVGIAAPGEPVPVAVTPWSARLVDDQCERDYQISRLPEERRRFQFVLVFIGLTAILNLAGDLLAIRLSAADLGWALLPQIALIAVVAASIVAVRRVTAPQGLETFVIAFLVFGIAAWLAVLSLHPRLGTIWPTMMAGVLIIIYFCMPLRVAALVAFALVYTVVAPLIWTIWVGPLPTPDDMYRTLLRMVLANLLGFSVANALQRSQRVQFAQNQLLQRLLSTDSLTGIANRRRFDHALTDEWRRCARAHKPLSLLMIDVDHFKAFNDAHGHLQGDECLRRVAGLLSQVGRRPGDLVARYGGEEFVCLLTDTNATGALLVAGRLQAAIDDACIPHPNSPLGPHLTVSIGAATAHPPAQSPESLVALADRLLYAAKERGRRGIAGGELDTPQADSREVRVA